MANKKETLESKTHYILAILSIGNFFSLYLAITELLLPYLSHGRFSLGSVIIVISTIVATAFNTTISGIALYKSLMLMYEKTLGIDPVYAAIKRFFDRKEKKKNKK
jgi:hypothetical protein